MMSKDGDKITDVGEGNAVYPPKVCQCAVAIRPLEDCSFSQFQVYCQFT